MAKTFEDISNGGSVARGMCPRCGVEAKAGQVQIRLSEFKDGDPSRYTQITSRAITMCETCSVEVYEELVGTLNAEGNGGSRAQRAPRPRVTTTPTTRRRRRRVSS